MLAESGENLALTGGGRVVLIGEALGDRKRHLPIVSRAPARKGRLITLDFLFSRNRLNVAVSRAMCLACIVASPRLLESRARTIEQMRLINALCRFAEMAGD